MSSTAVAAFSFKKFKENGLPEKPDVGIATTLRKRVDDATLSFTFTDASLKDPRSAKGVVLTAEKPLGVGIRAAVSHNFGSNDTTASLGVNKVLRGNDVQLRAVYRRRGDVFLLEETWKVDKANRLSGSYNFSTEEAVLSFSHDHGPYTATAGYNFAKEAPVVGVSRRRGPDTFGAVYAVKNDELTLQWIRRPLKWYRAPFVHALVELCDIPIIVQAAIRANGISNRQFSNISANLLITHEFLI